MGHVPIDVTVKELTVPNSPLIAKAYDAGLIKVTDIQDGVVGDLSTFRVDASKAGKIFNQSESPIFNLEAFDWLTNIFRRRPT